MLVSSKAKCLRFGLSLRLGLRCECLSVYSDVVGLLIIHVTTSHDVRYVAVSASMAPSKPNATMADFDVA